MTRWSETPPATLPLPAKELPWLCFAADRSGGERVDELEHCCCTALLACARRALKTLCLASTPAGGQQYFLLLRFADSLLPAAFPPLAGFAWGNSSLCRLLYHWLFVPAFAAVVCCTCALYCGQLSLTLLRRRGAFFLPPLLRRTLRLCLLFHFATLLANSTSGAANFNPPPTPA